MEDIVIAKKFPRIPFGRYTANNPHNAERSCREFLVLASKGTEQKIVVDFRGIAPGIGSPFLERVSRGLIRKEGTPRASIKARLIIKSDVPFYRE